MPEMSEKEAEKLVDTFDKVCNQIGGEGVSALGAVACKIQNIKGEYVGEMRIEDKQPFDVFFFTRAGRSHIRNAKLSYDEDKNVVIAKGKNSKIIFAPTGGVGEGSEIQRDPFLRYDGEDISGSHERLRYQRDAFYPGYWVPTSMTTKEILMGRVGWKEVPDEKEQVTQLSTPPYQLRQAKI